MDNLRDFLKIASTLPDGIDNDTLRPYWTRLFDLWIIGSSSQNDFTACLREMADRQWLTYECIGDDKKEWVEDWINENWDSNHIQRTNALIYVIGCLGIGGGIELMKHSIDDPGIDAELHNRLASAIRELGAPPLDPYRTLKE
jgi:hypothetical protein